MAFVVESKDQVLSFSFQDKNSRNAVSPSDASDFLQFTEDLCKEFEGLASTFAKKPPRIRALCLLARSSEISPKKRIALSGGNLKYLAQFTKLEEIFNYFYTMSLACLQLANLPFPILAFGDGELIGGGCEIFLASDLRFLSADSFLDFRQFQLGLCTGFGGAAALRRVLGPGIAGQILMREERISAEKALNLNLISQIYNSESDFENLLKSEISRILSRNPASFAIQKQLLRGKSCNLKESIKTKAKAQAQAILEGWGHSTQEDFLTKFR